MISSINSGAAKPPKILSKAAKLALSALVWSGGGDGQTCQRSAVGNAGPVTSCDRCQSLSVHHIILYASMRWCAS
jgi:hypothetical protein